ncbi:hypothetical protein WICPIJ_006613 [Wickerhamomyces pijperi]|uniref:Amidase domain-containing protein n=1 Tax=Wickerhamomyces pijperi TaxID=599730 RepID=A0A9P8Q1D2_WICPI|nr:hypothetical protein WICPIJ_006613 [Wickerhamomyces pijperi]
MSSTQEIYESKWIPKIQAYRQKLADQVKPYEYLVKDIDTSSPTFNAHAVIPTLLTPEEIKITGLKAIELVNAQKAGELTAVEIFKAFSKRGAIAHLLTNCAMELFFDEGLKQAEELDEYRASHGGELKGAFHGLPISVKEQMKFPGKVTHASYVAFLDNVVTAEPYSKFTSPIYDIVKTQGAVFYMRTAQPQAIMHLDTHNNITGRTTNPYNAKLSPGGSSGGASADAALAGSVISIGSDIGGSIRAPAAFCDLYGIRPTAKRIHSLGGLSAAVGQKSILAAQGPLTRSIEDLEYYMEHLINDGKPWEYDTSVAPMLWTKPDLGKEITVGFMMTDTIVEPADAIKRGLEFVKEKLSSYKDVKINIKLVNLDPALMKAAYTANLNCYGQSVNKQRKAIDDIGEPVLPLTEFYYGFEAKDNDIAANNIAIDSLTTYFFQQIFVKEGLDFIISPNSPNVADIPNNLRYWGYTSIYNMIDFPSIVFRTGLTYDVEKDVNGPVGVEGLVFNKEDYVNAPICLQVASVKYQEEKLVEMVKILDKALGL